MHEFSLLNSLLAKMNQIANAEKASRITKVKVKLGALAHISSDHFREHFVHAVKGSRAENAALEIEELQDETDPEAQNIILESVEIE